MEVAVARTSQGPDVPPSYSTFGTCGTSKRVGNPSGAEATFDGSGSKHKARKAFGSIGHCVGADVNPSNFLRATKGGGGTQQPAAETGTFQRTDAAASRRPAVPKATEKPVMGLTTDKNFVVSNAVDTILAPPKRVSKEDVQMTQKRGYGAPPPYLRRIKAEMSKEHARKAGESGEGAQSGTLDASMRLLTEAERKRLIAGLRQRWERSNQSYQSLTFSMDTVTKVSRKEMQESELETLEKAINKLSSKKCVFVYDDIDVGFETLGIQGCNPKESLQHQ